jgi:acetolactate synthase-1/2/3 large subunit
MRVVDAVAQALRAEGVEFLSAYPTTPMIDAAVRAGIRPVLCRQERVGVGIADGFSRVGAPDRFGVFACQYGPGIENALSGIASAHSDGIPILVLPLGNSLDRAQIRPLLRAERVLEPITKSFETVIRATDVNDVMRRAFSALRNGPGGPVVVELPGDVAMSEVPDDASAYSSVPRARSAGDPEQVERAVDLLQSAQSPLILAGHGVLRAGASSELVALAQLLAAPVITTLAGKSAIPEDHPLSVGVASVVASDAVVETLRSSDVVLMIGSSQTRHFLSPVVPPEAKLIQATLDPRDLGKGQRIDCALLGDAQLILVQLLEAARQRGLAADAEHLDQLAARIAAAKRLWLEQWLPRLTSEELPMTPYRVIHEFMQAIDPRQAVVTHDSGSPRDQLAPFYLAGGPNTYMGWGKSHALGGGLGLTIGAKLAAPEKLAVHIHGDAAFGMTGLDIETAARSGVPIVSVVLNNSTMAIETRTLVESHEQFGTRDIGGDYAELARAIGVEARRVEAPSELGDAFRWARSVNESGRPALIEVITSAETGFVNRHAINSSPRDLPPPRVAAAQAV